MHDTHPHRLQGEASSLPNVLAPRSPGHRAAGMPRACMAVLGLLVAFSAHAESQCFGTVSNGRLEQGVQLPSSGANFGTYSTLAAGMGRTHVHSRVAEVVADAYAALQKSRPGTVYVYGETGWPSGGRIRPHRTHQNGLSVDFFVPVLDAAGRSVPLPTPMSQRFGYDIEFDKQARHGELRIDFEALADHMVELHQAGKRRGVGISLVIFDTAYLPKLFATARGKYLQQHLPFMKGKPWVRHDEHYHVDFQVPCRPGSP
jgi:penicillin-insensitive murein endopeptidase